MYLPCSRIQDTPHQTNRLLPNSSHINCLETPHSTTAQLKRYEGGRYGRYPRLCISISVLNLLSPRHDQERSKHGHQQTALLVQKRDMQRRLLLSFTDPTEKRRFFLFGAKKINVLFMTGEQGTWKYREIDDDSLPSALHIQTSAYSRYSIFARKR